MSFNGTLAGTFEEFAAKAQPFIPQSGWSLLLLVPVLAVVLNALRQLIIPVDPSAPPVIFHWIPIFGSAAQYGQDPLKFLLDCRDKHGDVFTFILMGRKITVALGARGNNFILGGKSTAFSAEDAYTHLTTPVFGKDVVYDVPNDVFMEQKKFVKVGLSQSNLVQYVGMIEDEVVEFLKNDPAFTAFQSKDSNEWGSFDSVDILAQMTILTAARTLQGTEVRSKLDKTFSELYNDLDAGFTPLNFMFPNLPLPSYARRDRANAKMTEFYIDIINKRRANPGEGENDIIAALMNEKYRNGGRLADHQIAHMMIALLMAGQHTSSATGAWSLLHVASRPDIGEALYQEQVANFSTPDGKLRSMSLDELKALPLLDAVIRETLRMHPPIHSIMRYVREDVPVPTSLSTPPTKAGTGTYVVPKGHYVLASPSVSQCDPRVWKESSEWDPYRWSDPAGVAAQAYNDYSDVNGEKIDYGFGAVSKGTESPYQPFGAGRHRCIGEQFAYLQLGTLIATMVRSVEMKLKYPVPAHNYHTMIVMPLKPRDIYYRRRNVD